MKVTVTKEKLLYALALIIPLLLGAFLRFYNLGKMIIFYGDNSRDFLTTYKIIKFHEIVWHGPAASVTWNLLSPIYYYLLIPFYLLSGWHPLTQQVLTALLSLLTIILIFLTIRNLFDQKAAFMAALIYAVGAVIIPENLIGLNPGFVPLATVLFTWALVRVLRGDDKKFPLLAASLAWMISFHASSFFIIPVLIILFLVKRPRISKKSFIIGGLLFFFLAIVPYGIQEKKFGGYNFITVYNYFFSKDVTAKSISEYVPLKTSLINYSQIIYKTPAEILLPINSKATYPVSFVLWLSFLIFIYRNRSKLPSNAKWLILILALYTLVFGIGVRFRFSERPNWWFGCVFFPIFSLVNGYLISQIKPKLLLTMFLTILVISNTAKLWSYAASGVFGQYDQEKEIAQIILNDAGPTNFDLKYIYDDLEEPGSVPPLTYLFWYFGTPRYQERYFAWLNWGNQGPTNATYLVFQGTAEDQKLLNIKKIEKDENRTVFRVLSKKRDYEIDKLE